MNIGFYVKSLTDEDELRYIIDEIEHAKDSNIIDDSSIFYDSIGFTPFSYPCGLFNSTDLWHFSGKLITFSLDSLRSAISIANNIELFYCFGWEKEFNVLNLLDLVLRQEIKVLLKTEEDQKLFYRLTGKKTMGYTNSQQLIELIG